MPPGRPRKNNITKYFRLTIDDEINQDNIQNNIQDNIAVAKTKRKYTKRKPKENIQKKYVQIPKKRGRKRGRKRKDQDLIMKPEEILDYMIRNYPRMGIEHIKDDVIRGIKKMKEMGNSPYVLDRFMYEDNIYYEDDKGAILNSDAVLVGYFIEQNGQKNIYMFKNKDDDNRTYEEIIRSIESIKNN